MEFDSPGVLGRDGRAADASDVEAAARGGLKQSSHGGPRGGLLFTDSHPLVTADYPTS